MFFILRKNYYFKSFSLKGSLGNQKWFFYGITAKTKTFGTFIFKIVESFHSTKCSLKFFKIIILRKNDYFKNLSLKGSLGDQKLRTIFGSQWAFQWKVLKGAFRPVDRLLCSETGIHLLHCCIFVPNSRYELWYRLVRWSVGSDCFLTMSERSRVRLQSSRDHLFREVSVRLFGLLLVRTRVRLLHSHLPKWTAPRGTTNSSAIQPN